MGDRDGAAGDDGRRRRVRATGRHHRQAPDLDGDGQPDTDSDSDSGSQNS